MDETEGSSNEQEAADSIRKRKKERVVELLDQEKLDAVLISLQSNFSWYTDGGSAFVNVATERSIAQILVTRSEDHLFVDSIEHARLTDEELKWRIDKQHVYEWRNGNHDPLEDPAFTHLRFETDRGKLGEKFARLRYSLFPEEIERYEKLGKETANAVSELRTAVHKGMTEYELAGELALRLLSSGIYPIVILIAFDERIARYRHPLPTGNKLRKTALVSVCGRRAGMVASLSRLFSLGQASPDLQRKHAAVAAIDAWLVQNTVVGSRIADLFDGLQKEYALRGYVDEWKLHHQGGATGYATRDYRASSTSTEIVLDNQAFAWNPSITGIKSEDTILLCHGGARILTEDSHWPSLTVERGGQVLRRPDILVL